MTEYTDKELLGVIEDLCIQFAYESSGTGICTGGLSVLESAFSVLGWDDPHDLGDSYKCKTEGCSERATCGTPTNVGYKRVCGEHFDQLQKAQEY